VLTESFINTIQLNTKNEIIIHDDRKNPVCIKTQINKVNTIFVMDGSITYHQYLLMLKNKIPLDCYVKEDQIDDVLSNIYKLKRIYVADVVRKIRKSKSSSDTTSVKSDETKTETESTISEITTKTKNIKARIPKALKIQVWNEYIGIDIGRAKCMVCEVREITQSSFHCAHIIAEVNGGEMNVENMRPCCELCNKSMSTQHLIKFKKQLSIVDYERRRVNLEFLDRVISDSKIDDELYNYFNIIITREPIIKCKKCNLFANLCNTIILEIKQFVYEHVECIDIVEKEYTTPDIGFLNEWQLHIKDIKVENSHVLICRYCLDHSIEVSADVNSIISFSIKHQQCLRE
jgi:hypothetical protein